MGGADCCFWTTGRRTVGCGSTRRYLCAAGRGRWMMMDGRMPMMCLADVLGDVGVTNTPPRSAISCPPLCLDERPVLLCRWTKFSGNPACHSVTHRASGVLVAQPHMRLGRSLLMSTLSSPVSCLCAHTEGPWGRGSNDAMRERGENVLDPGPHSHHHTPCPPEFHSQYDGINQDPINGTLPSLPLLGLSLATGPPVH